MSFNLPDSSFFHRVCLLNNYSSLCCAYINFSSHFTGWLVLSRTWDPLLVFVNKALLEHSPAHPPSSFTDPWGVSELYERYTAGKMNFELNPSEKLQGAQPPETDSKPDVWWIRSAADSTQHTAGSHCTTSLKLQRAWNTLTLHCLCGSPRSTKETLQLSFGASVFCEPPCFYCVYVFCFSRSAVV